MDQTERVIFTRTFDLLAWLLSATNHFPRAHRHDFTRRLLDAAFDLREFVAEANVRRGPARQERLARADGEAFRPTACSIVAGGNAPGPDGPSAFALKGQSTGGTPQVCPRPFFMLLSPWG